MEKSLFIQKVAEILQTDDMHYYNDKCGKGCNIKITGVWKKDNLFLQKCECTEKEIEQLKKLPHVLSVKKKCTGVWQGISIITDISISKITF